ncbi:hypothetical protein FRC04_005591 [Tulasnella sp. 424]|nr:hypothetical protein FRC04_005591 [Tulasnella sp. 424]KAG8966007.1 hypothetical protein FRC05_002927 [Tulasnella sp. 425]
MSTLASRLLTNNESADNELDALFKSSAGAVVPSKSHEASSSKRPAEEETSLTNTPKKRAKTRKSDPVERPSEPAVIDTKKKGRKEKKHADAVSLGEDHPVHTKQGKSLGKPTKKTEQGKTISQPKDVSKASTRIGSTASSSKKKKQNHKGKYVPPGEKPEEVDARTVFVGNLPASMVKNNSAMKLLIRHLTSSLSATAKARVESTRFRSVAFSHTTRSSKDASNDISEDEESDEEGINKQDTMTSSQKKRLAFLKGEMNEKAEVVNCYVVFGHHRSNFIDEGVSKTASEEKPMIPSEVAELVVRAANGTEFMDRVIRVDRVGAAKSATSGTAREEMKRTAFVGSLDFEAHEDDVRAFFEELLRAERGEPVPEVPREEETEDGGKDGDEDGEAVPDSKRKSWVHSVRIVRDPDSQLGKGIAYVQFKDVQCVDELLALPSAKLSFRKRTLRLQRCKTLPRTASSKSSSTPSVPPTKSPSSRSPNKSSNSRLPKGDPGLGARLADLSKEERKEAKALDTDRVARRLAKKKLRADLEKEKGHGRRSGGKEGILGKMPKSTKPKNPGLKKAKKISKKQ